jgi:hypothetical protein
VSCAQFLAAVRETDHRMVMTDTLREEWDWHRSNFAARWLRTMYVARKVDGLSVEADEDLRKALTLDVSEKDAETMLKDVHLLEAALATDWRVASKETGCRECFRSVAPKVKAIRKIYWVDPTIAEEEPIEWLHRGAPLDAHRRLGAP